MLPGVGSLAWLLFMQPLQLHQQLKDWGVDPEASLWSLRQRWREPLMKRLLGRLALILWLGTPLGGGLALACQLLGLEVDWVRVAGGVAFGVMLGVAGAVAGGVAYGVAGGVAGGVSFLRLPSYILEAGATLLHRGHLALGAAPSAVRFLPFCHHDLIYFPLPGLRSLLVAIAEAEPQRGEALIAEAAASIGQRRPARLALAELRARSLEHAARERQWALVADLSLPFIPRTLDGLLSSETRSPWRTFQAAARDLLASQQSQSHFHIRRTLESAEQHLLSLQRELTAQRRLDPFERRLQPVLQQWLRTVGNEAAQLSAREQQAPQVPTPFIAGERLRASDGALFKGRQDLVKLIDHDLTGQRRAPLLLFGQRRMGKSSLLERLPLQLGSATVVVPLNFQALSGADSRGQPHRWLAQALFDTLQQQSAASAAALGSEPLRVPAPPQNQAWSATLDWLVQVDAALASRGQRALIAIDELERLQDGIEAGWTDASFLDFARAAGDQLSHIRLLLVSAHSLQKLGRHWTDRLISAVQREITFLSATEARELICAPIPGFPDIYPPGGVDGLLHETNGHPYLIQLICDELTRLLNAESRLVATDHDLERAIDASFNQTALYSELWSQQSDAERSWLRRLAHSEATPRDGATPDAALPEPDAALLEPDAALRALERAHFVERRGGRWRIAVPLFASWIRSEAV